MLHTGHLTQRIQAYLLMISLFPLFMSSASIAQSLIIEPDHLYFGTTEASGSLSKWLLLRNAGEKPIRVFGIDPSCEACTEVQFAPAVIDPGESIEVEVVIFGNGHEAHHYKSVRVRSNDPHQPEMDVRLEAHFVPAIGVSQWTIDLGQVAPAANIVHPLSISNWSSESISIELDSNITTAAWITPQSLEEGELTKPSHSLVDLKILTPFQSGRFEIPVNIHTSSQVQPELSLRVVGEVIWDDHTKVILKSEYEQLMNNYLGTINSDTAVERSINIQSQEKDHDETILLFAAACNEILSDEKTLNSSGLISQVEALPQDKSWCVSAMINAIKSQVGYRAGVYALSENAFSRAGRCFHYALTHAQSPTQFVRAQVGLIQLARNQDQQIRVHQLSSTFLQQVARSTPAKTQATAAIFEKYKLPDSHWHSEFN